PRSRRSAACGWSGSSKAASVARATVATSVSCTTASCTHAHLRVEAADASALARGMKSIGARLARAVNRVCGRRRPVLAERFHVRVLRTPREVRRAVAYVLLNARRHARHRRQVNGIDPASSGRWFAGWLRVPPGTRSGPDAPAVARPRTWLLRAGWRRHGLI